MFIQPTKDCGILTISIWARTELALFINLTKTVIPVLLLFTIIAFRGCFQNFMKYSVTIQLCVILVFMKLLSLVLIKLSLCVSIKTVARLLGMFCPVQILYVTETISVGLMTEKNHVILWVPYTEESQTYPSLFETLHQIKVKSLLLLEIANKCIINKEANNSGLLIAWQQKVALRNDTK